MRQPHAHRKVLGVTRGATAADAGAAVDAATAAAPAWRDLSFDDRAAILLKAADLLAGPWRARINAATMLGQSKTAYQAEIDAACELIDFWRFNVHFARRSCRSSRRNSRGMWNRSDYRSLEGFVYAVTPFNFTAIAGNLPTAPALMGNTVVWKPSPLAAARRPADHGAARGGRDAARRHQPGHRRTAVRCPTWRSATRSSRAALHRLDRGVPGPVAQIGENLDELPALPAHRRRDRRQGLHAGPPQRRPRRAAHRDDPRRVRVPGPEVLRRLTCLRAALAVERHQERPGRVTNGLAVGDVTDLSNFMGAVIDDRAFAKHKAAIDRAHATSHLDVVAGGTYDDSVGYFVRPTVVESSDPTDEMFSTEYFGPILAVHVYPDRQYSKVLDQMESFAPYALTGAIIAQDRAVIADATQRLRFAAGNFYVNDKPTGAVVGQQPFGGGRASGTNDKAGSAANLMRWTSVRSIKENFVPPTSHGYPHMG